MNIFTKALDNIRAQIPLEILQLAFMNDDMRANPSMVSLDSRIREAVIDSRVVVDLDIYGGSEVYIDLSAPGVALETVDMFTSVYHIADEVTQNRRITTVYSIHFGVLGYQGTLAVSQGTASPLQAGINSVLDAAQRTQPALTNYINLIGHNTIMVRFAYRPYPQAFARVRLGNDNALSHIRYPYFGQFAQLCMLATKAKIYNTMMVYIDQGQLSGGQTLGAYRNFVEGYADAEQMYQEALQGWKASTVYNDPESRRHYLRTLVGGGW